MKSLIAVLIGLMACPFLQAQNCSLRLVGHVHNSASHENLAGATIHLSTGQQIVTNANGDFTFTDLCEAEYIVTISHAGYETWEQHLVLNRNLHLDFDLTPSENTLSEVTVTGLMPIANTGMRKEISGNALDAARSVSLAEALSRLNGVTILQTGSTISKPVIHGLHSARIVTVNNGVRQEGQQWGNEHAPEIDPFIAGSLTVIKGVDELRYGSDAIGGVVLIEPRQLRNRPGTNAELNLAYHTNNRQYTASGIFEHQPEKFQRLTYRLQGTFKKGANIQTPEYRLNNTALQELNYSATASWRQEHFETELFYSRFQNDLGIFAGAHIGNISDLMQAIESPRPDPTFTGQNTYAISRPRQHVDHQLIKSKTRVDIGNQVFNILLSGQSNYRQEFDVIRDETNTSAQLNLRVYTFNEEINWQHPEIFNLRGTLGITATQQDNSYSGRYLIPNYTSQAYGAYFIEKWRKNDWNAEAGIRYDWREINTSRLQASSQTYSSYRFLFGTLASSANIGYRVINGLRVNLAASLSTRAPQVNELLTNGIHHGTGTYEQGNIDLDPEQAFNLSLNSTYENASKTFRTELTLHNNRINNFIYQQPRPGEPVLTIRGAFPRIVYEHTDALLRGMDFSAEWNLTDHILAGASYSLLRARNRLIDDWLILMPADRLGGELTIAMPALKKLPENHLTVELQHVFEQTRVPAQYAGKHDYASPPPAYTLLHAGISTRISSEKWPVTIRLSGRNLLNTTYRDYLNMFRYFTDEMGRNFMLSVKLNFNNNL